MLVVPRAHDGNIMGPQSIPNAQGGTMIIVNFNRMGEDSQGLPTLTRAFSTTHESSLEELDRQLQAIHDVGNLQGWRVSIDRDGDDRPLWWSPNP